MNGNAVLTSGTTVGDTATVSCNVGYTLSGDSSITCGSNGWSSVPTCEIQGKERV